MPQLKEPAFSRPLLRFVNPQTDGMTLPGRPSADLDNLPVDEIIRVAKDAKIVDERDGKMLHNKLLKAKGKVVAVIADAVDDEPYVSSKISPLFWQRKEVMGGLALCKKVADTDKVFIMAYKLHRNTESRLPSNLEGVPVIKLRGKYPARPHASQIKVGQGKKLVVGTGALVHLYRAVKDNKRQSTVFLTVAGNCVANSMNLEVSMGMTVSHVLDRCGLTREPTRIVCGGPMTGIAIIDPDKTLITYSTRAVLALWESKADKYYSCIGCGRCEQVCPVGLSPMYIHRFVENSYYANLKPFDAHRCIGCGTCSYMCPSKLNVAGSAIQAKEYALSHFIKDSGEADDLDD